MPGEGAQVGVAEPVPVSPLEAPRVSGRISRMAISIDSLANQLGIPSFPGLSHLGHLGEVESTVGEIFLFECFLFAGQCFLLFVLGYLSLSQGFLLFFQGFLLFALELTRVRVWAALILIVPVP